MVYLKPSRSAMIHVFPHELYENTSGGMYMSQGNDENGDLIKSLR
jgi:hypothetical protein